MREFLFILGTILILSGCSSKPALQSPFVLTQQHQHNAALIVPLHGPYAASGKAIRDGLLTAYYYSIKHGQSDTSIQIIDSTSDDIYKLYDKAIKDGANFVVGPLLKQNLQKLIDRGNFPVPTLSLNTVDDFNNYQLQNLYQFGLFSADEAAQAAARAWQDHPGQALIITPGNNWGNNLATIYENTWQSFGGKISAVLMYNPQKHLNNQIRDILNINLSEQNASALKKILREKFKFVPRRRKDIDTILLIALPDKARQINPLLKFYYAGDIPVYAISSIYTDTKNPTINQDLNDIVFCDMPWVLQKDSKLPAMLPSLKAEIIKLWPSSYTRYSRLYALGIDSFYLILNLETLLTHPHTGIAGATGIFYIDKYQHIYRQLSWARIQNGLPILIVTQTGAISGATGT